MMNTSLSQFICININIHICLASKSASGKRGNSTGILTEVKFKAWLPIISTTYYIGGINKHN